MVSSQCSVSHNYTIYIVIVVSDVSYCSFFFTYSIVDQQQIAETLVSLSNLYETVLGWS